jgi:hypothetical protein
MLSARHDSDDDKIAERREVMADGIEIFTERVQSVEEQVVHLTGRVHVVEEKVDQLSTSMGHRFDAVDAAFVDQRSTLNSPTRGSTPK